MLCTPWEISPICQKSFVCNKTIFSKRLKVTFWVLRRKTLVHKVDLLEKSILLPLSPSLLQATSSLVRVPNPLALGRRGACPPHLRLRLKQAALSSANRGQAVKQTSGHLTINAWWISKRPLLIEDKLVVAFTTNNINNVENNEQHQLRTSSITSSAIAHWISWRPYIVWQSFYTSCWCPHYRHHHRWCWW